MTATQLSMQETIRHSHSHSGMCTHVHAQVSATDATWGGGKHDCDAGPGAASRRQASKQATAKEEEEAKEEDTVWGSR